jgi:diaminopimelate decarboxylase
MTSHAPQPSAALTRDGGSARSAQGRPPAFLYRSAAGKFAGKSSAGKTKALHCEAVPLTELAAKFGTPLYVYSATAIRQRFQAFDAAFRAHPHTVCYSVKANSNLSILRLLVRLGAGFDVVSGGELERVLLVDRRAARRVVFSGVGKTPAEMDAALRAGILMFNLESEAELHVLAERAARLGKTARIAFRVNPDVKAGDHPYIATGLHQHKFGVPIAEARNLYALAAEQEHLEPVGVSVHIGSQITDVAPFRQAMQRVLSLTRQLLADGLNIGYIDAGGGLGISYQNEPRFDLRKLLRLYSAALLAPLRKTDLHLLLEPGRSIVAPAGALLTRKLYSKENRSKRFLIVDAAMNDLIRPSLYGAYHEIAPVTMARGPASSWQAVDVVGPVCESGDFFARDRELPAIEPGELLAILDAGAYGMVMASNYNTRPRPAEVLVEGSRSRLIRRRETVRDILRPEM